MIHLCPFSPWDVSALAHWGKLGEKVQKEGLSTVRYLLVLPECWGTRGYDHSDLCADACENGGEDTAQLLEHSCVTGVQSDSCFEDKPFQWRRYAHLFFVMYVLRYASFGISRLVSFK